MCGVFATTDLEFWHSKTDQIIARLSHRGPDDSSSEIVDQSVLMVHTRLEVIGLGADGQQPANSFDEAVTLTFNGEIYNYRELGRTMCHGPVRSDTQVLAQVVREREISALGQLRGMFAFAAWDRRDGALLAMRDPFGIKPLYVLHHVSGAVSLCSEIAPLLLCPEAHEIDSIGLAEFLATGHTGNGNTLFRRIQKLDPGSLYIWRRDRNGVLNLQIERPVAWPTPDMTFEEAIEDSVVAHLTADVEVGAFLSSGVDSTLLCALAQRHVPGMRTYTLTFPESPGLDESQLASTNAAQMGLRNTVVQALRSDMVSAARDIVRVHGEPMGDAAVLPLAVLARRASQDLKVVLTGEGGDELFGGYGRYKVSRRLGMVTWATGLVNSHLAPRWARVRSDNPRPRAVEALLWGGGIRSHTALLCGDLPLLAEIRPDVHTDVLAVMSADWKSVGVGGTEFARALAYDRLHWLPNTYLEKTDRTTMLSGLEARVPYLDPVLAATASAKSMQLHAKEESRELLRSRFPDLHCPSRKRGLSVAIGPLLDFPALAEPLAYELRDPNSIIGQWIPAGRREVVVERSRRSPTLAFRLAMLGVWEEVNSVCLTR